MARYSVDGVDGIGILEEIDDVVVSDFVIQAFEGGNGSATKQWRGEDPRFFRTWNHLQPVSNARTQVSEAVFLNLRNNRTTILGFSDPDQVGACINTLRQKAKGMGLSPLTVRGVADQKGGIGVGIVRSLVAIRTRAEEI